MFVMQNERVERTISKLIPNKLILYYFEIGKFKSKFKLFFTVLKLNESLSLEYFFLFILFIRYFAEKST